MSPSLLLIDALNLIRRVHAAVRAPDESSQVDGAISSTISSLSRAIRKSNPTHALVIFDGNPPTWRHELFPDYKKDRKPMPELLRKRLGDFNKAFLSMGVKTFRKSGLEADDVIAAIATKAAQANVEVTILSTDRVFQQLLTSDGIKARDHFQKVDFTRTSVIHQYGFEPEQLIDYWAIAGVGDIPGVHGIGEKGASTLIKEHQSLQNILELGKCETVQKGAIGKIVSQTEQALLSQKMARLACDLELGVRLKDLRYEPATSAAG